MKGLDGVSPTAGMLEKVANKILSLVLISNQL